MPTPPPGSRGLPLIGETIPFARDGIRFMADRVSAHGSVSITRLLGSDVYLLAGPDAMAAFLDPDNVAREHAMPPHLVKIFGRGAVNQLDGDAHRVRKRLILAALSREALESYIPTDVARIRDGLASWKQRGRIRLMDAGRQLSMQVIIGDFVGVTDPGERDWYAESYGMVVEALFALPFDLPGFALHRALRRKAEVLDRYGALIRDRRQSPGPDGLSRILAAEVDGHTLDDATAAMELHHLVLAGFGTFGFWVGAAVALARDPALRPPLEAVVAALPDVPTPADLMQCAPLLHFMYEVKRTTPILPLIAGKALRDFDVGDYCIPKGATVMWALHASHNQEGVSAFDAPTTFDPGRYDRGEQDRHAYAHAPQGGGDPTRTHACAGIDFSGLLTMAFVAEMLRSEVTFPEQDLGFETAGIPGPRDGMVLAW